MKRLTLWLLMKIEISKLYHYFISQVYFYPFGFVTVSSSFCFFNTWFFSPIKYSFNFWLPLGSFRLAMYESNLDAHAILALS